MWHFPPLAETEKITLGILCKASKLRTRNASNNNNIKSSNKMCGQWKMLCGQQKTSCGAKSRRAHKEFCATYQSREFQKSK